MHNETCDDYWADLGENRHQPLLPTCEKYDCKRFIVTEVQLDLYPRELVMTCVDCFDNFLVNLEISAKVIEKVEQWRRKMEKTAEASEPTDAHT